ncbi:MAG TPA: DUF5602 domain-containing protein [Ramlibacter sp.]|nr:DUF5602 domain-containing protein [Ramlibacter sp.]
MKPRQLPGIARGAIVMAMAFSIAPGAMAGENNGTIYTGKAVRLGNGTAHTVVRADAGGKAVSIGVVLTEKALEGLPAAPNGASTDFPFLLPMPAKGPKTVVDHVVVNWNPQGHPPPKIYEVPHFDFHFYLRSPAYQKKVRFKSDAESGDPRQQPAAELLAAGYVVPPGTAVSKMGAHAINPASPEFNGQPFTATFIYGYHNKQLTFLEPMAALDFLKSKPAFSAPVSRPAKYLKAGAYPSSYSVKYDNAARSYVVSLEGLQ